MISTNYEPNVNDYVIWKSSLKGWVYFKCNSYITIEAFIRPKNAENYRASPIHANDRLLVVCYREQWNELNYVRSRLSIEEE